MSSLIKSTHLSCHEAPRADRQSVDLNSDSSEQVNHQIERATRRARSIMEQARERSEGIIERALQGTKQLEEHARNEGFAAGHKEGVERGMTEALKVVEQMQRYQEEVAKEYQAMLARAEHHLAHVSVELAERIVGEVISLEPERILDMARAVIGQLTDETGIRIRTHTDYADLLEVHRQQLLSVAPGVTSVEVVADESLSPGVVVEGKWGYVDGTLHAQLKEADRVIKDANCE